MKLYKMAGALALVALTSCNMQNPLLTESPLPYGAPQFDKIKAEHYMPAFKQGIKENKAEIDAIVANPEAPTFENTIEALEYSGKTLGRVSSIFFNILEADSTPQLQKIAEDVTPMLNDISLYISLNEKLFDRVKAVYEGRDTLGLEKDQLRLLEKTYESFAENGANLSPEDKQTYGKLTEELSLATLKFGNNSLAATNAYTLNITDESDLDGLPDYAIAVAAETAKAKGQEGWTFDLSYPSYGPFMKFSTKRELRKQMYMAYNTRATEGEFSNAEIVKQIAGLRLEIAKLLGSKTYAQKRLKTNMLNTPDKVNNFIEELLEPSLPAARREMEELQAFASENGFDEQIQSWDLSYWSEKLMNAKYALSENELKPYFELGKTIDAVLGLATKLYDITFEERTDIPVYNKDVKVFDVKEENGRHLALFYADFFPRESKRSGAWMTSFGDNWIQNGVEQRPFINIVTNFSKPTENDPSLLTHDEVLTFLHEFGHALHGILSEGRYSSLNGTNVAHDFVELPSQIMENWGYEPEYLQSFAVHYKTGEPISQELIDKIVAAKNFQSAYGQVRQLQFGLIDMAWHDTESVTELGTVEFEKSIVRRVALTPEVPGTCMSTAFTHLFSGGYAAGYYAYKWAEVLEADAFSLFKEKGIFNHEVSYSFLQNVLQKGSQEDEAISYRNYRGHDPEVKALLDKLGISSK